MLFLWCKSKFGDVHTFFELGLVVCRLGSSQVDALNFLISCAWFAVAACAESAPYTDMVNKVEMFNVVVVV